MARRRGFGRHVCLAALLLAALLLSSQLVDAGRKGVSDAKGDLDDDCEVRKYLIIQPPIQILTQLSI